MKTINAAKNPEQLYKREKANITVAIFGISLLFIHTKMIIQINRECAEKI